MTARVFLALVLATTLVGCGGSWTVCGQFDMPDYCKLPKTQSVILTLNNACPYPVAVGTTGSKLPPPASGSSPLQPSATSVFEIARSAGQPWSAAVFPAGQARSSRAELTLRDDTTAAYAVKIDPALPMSVRPLRADCDPADAEHPGPYACRANADYVITFCPPEPGK